MHSSYTFMLSDVSIVWRSFSLPILEPLTPERLEKIVMVTMSCLFASITVAMSNTIINMMKPAAANQPAPAKEEEAEGCGVNVVQKTVSMDGGFAATGFVSCMLRSESCSW